MKQWVEEELSTSDLGDMRLDDRFKKMMNSMDSTPSSSLPTTFENHSELMAAYRFIDNGKTDYQNLLLPHLESTKTRLSGEKVVLAVQDTTSIDYTKKRGSANLGHLEHKKHRGLFLHATLAISPDRVNLGILSAKLWTRDPETIGKKHKRKALPIEEKESYRWIESQQSVAAIAATIPDTTFICVGDRENDIYEAFVQNSAAPKNVEILIRCIQNRKLTDDSVESKLFEAIENSLLLGHIEVKLPARPGKKKRTARLELKSTKIKFKAPRRPDKIMPDEEITMVQAKETNPPKGEQAIVWNLLTSLDASDYESSLQMVEYYRCRWEIEQYFKIIKSGCNIESLHLEEVKRLETTIALYMIISWRTQYLMMLSREKPKMLAEEVFDQIEIRAIYIMREKKLPKKPPQLETVALMLAQSGGYLARKNDPPPGPKAFWQAFEKLASNVLFLNRLESCV